MIHPHYLYTYILEYDQDLLNPPAINDIRNNTMKMQKNILAISAAPAAIPVNPKMAAIRAITKKITVQRNITNGFRLTIRYPIDMAII